MLDTIGTQSYPSTACAVFKIDLKGRFVYVDDETEDLFGLSREELFGKSLYDFIMPETRRQLDAVLRRHSRCELFFESLPLMIQTEFGMRQLDAVVTVNFISGSPVNYQFILRLSATSNIEPVATWERMFLDLLRDAPDEIDFGRLAEVCSTASGYPTTECYIPDSRGALKMIAAFPSDNPGHTAPAYLDTYRGAGEDRFSFRAGDISRHEGFGDGRSEALLFLWHDGGKNLVLRLTGPEGYRPSDRQINNIGLFTRLWNRHAEQNNRVCSLGDKLDIIGDAGAALGFGVTAVTGDFEIVYANEIFLRIVGRSELADAERDFRSVASAWDIRDPQSRPLTFEQSLFSEVMEKRQLCVGCIIIPGSSESIIALAAPMEAGDDPLFLYCLTNRCAHVYTASPVADRDNFGLLSLVHDIRAPLITIEAFTRRLRSKYADRLDSDGKFITDGIIENSRILQEMIDGLNELSRNRSDDEPAQDIYVKELLKNVTQELKSAYPGTQYRIKIPGGLPSIRAPKRKLTALFRNILDNAFKYTASVSEPAIEIEYALEAGRHRFRIIDNGPGIEPDYAKKIFAPFFRTPEASTIQGNGIGLALAHDILVGWGGKIWVERPEQRGMRIAFTLPPDISR